MFLSMGGLHDQQEVADPGDGTCDLEQAIKEGSPEQPISEAHGKTDYAHRTVALAQNSPEVLQHQKEERERKAQREALEQAEREKVVRRRALERERQRRLERTRGDDFER